jgi:hypothetical protein
MPQDADADVVKIVIHEERCIRLIVRQGVAEVATGLTVEQFPAVHGRVADGVGLSGDEMVEGRIEGSQSLLVLCNSAQHILLVYVPAEGLRELSLIVLVAGNPGHRIADTGRAHLERICDRQRSLLLERIDPAVPELRLVIERIQHGWGVALADAAMDAD